MSILPFSRTSETAFSTHPGSKSSISRYVMNQEEELELQHLNAAVERINKAVPTDPYIVTVPDDPPLYRYFDGHFGLEGHCEGVLFEYDESQLQYSTFVLRDHEKTLFMLQSKLDQERERRAQDKQRNGHAEERPTTSATSAPRKKLTFGQYKAKKEGKLSNTPTPTFGPTRIVGGEARKGIPEINLDQVVAKLSAMPMTRPMDAPENDVLSEHRNVSESEQGYSHSRKRSYEEAIGTKSTHKPKADSRPSEEQKPAKKSRSSPPPPSVGKEPSKRISHGSATERHDPENLTPHGLPPMISPTLPPSNGDSALNSKSQSPPWGLPPMLDDDLPETIEVELRKLSGGKQSGKKIPPKSPAVASPDPSAGPKAIARSMKKPSGSPSLPKNGDSVDHDPPRNVPREADEVAGGTGRRRSLISTLKFRKASRARLQSVLKDADNVTNTTNNRVDPVKGEKVAKNSKERSDSTSVSYPPATRRSKDSAVLEPTKEKPSQAAPSNGLPAINQSSPPALITPTIHTPGSAPSNAATPSSIGPSSSTRPRSRVRNTSSPEECEYWKLLAQQYSTLGRKLKRTSGDMFNSNRFNPSSREHAASLLLSLECIMAFMLSFYLADYRRYLRNNTPGDLEQWKSLLPLWKEFRARFYVIGMDGGKYSPLLGIHFALGVAIASHIGHVAQQVYEMSKNERNRPSTSNGTAGKSAPVDKNSWTAHLAPPHVLHDNHESLLSWSAKASSILFDHVAAAFPRTVERASKREPPMGASQWFTHRAHRLKVLGW
ncbi:hypothetical protein P152DRAFT_272578 [Eremomyces bilateralis CBS 781.70]|uniref:Uncharacterized protein n=1 Tax=Eremomyces bilateralis CBS 781.70 TaxID=1392243 RepID=A0A6G1G983_9PEZI|nr:uncharacterized protein P152DRAFT_272578 [Eremomyces bilateralis CBS 781.70]KAF1814461.1 hypothetical protein P152DRAFT_272578 [Eremomyces bilateralis CBS 781.70]